MKIKRFKLADGVTKEELLALRFRRGGSWIMKDAELFLSRTFYNQVTNFEYSIDIAFGSDINDWNDFDNVLVMDEDFGQPYGPFYGENYGKDISDFPELENVILTYNHYMSTLGIFEEII